MSNDITPTSPRYEVGGADVPTPPGDIPTPASVPLYLRIWRAVWGTTPTPTEEGGTASTDGTREIIETIVFVVVLVLMLRCFVAEAFVIPTGSMAETLYGYQKMVTCPQCNFFFPVNCSSEVEAIQEGRPDFDVTSSCVCPNCRLPINLAAPGTPIPPQNSVNTIPDPGYSTGDRVLVAKFLYDLLGRSPDRLDVVVFKFPGDGDKGGLWPDTGPQLRGVPMNYIKRLVGLPGETIYIYRGDLYHSAKADPELWTTEDFQDCKTEEEKAARRLMLWRARGERDYTHSKTVDATRETEEHRSILDRMRKDEIRIVRKPADKILAERRIVYDNDYPAADLIQARQEARWKPETDAWTAQGTEFQSKATEGTSWLRYRHLVRNANGMQEANPELIGDFLGYNSDPKTNQNGAGKHWVKDLLLECEVEVTSPQGQFTLELSSGVDRFRAVWNLADGICTLYRIQPHGAGIGAALGMEQGEKLASQPTAIKQPGKYRVRFANFDRQLVVWVDGSLPFGANGHAYAAPENQNWTEHNDVKEPASIGVTGAAVTVRHVSLWRDVYYTVGTDRDETSQIRQMYVQPDHYLCLGDNSPASSDGRRWGLVPSRLLLGKAQVVYYPFYFPWWPLKAPTNRVGLIR